MRKFFRLMASFAFMFSALTVPAMAEDGSSARMQRLMPYFEKFMKLPEDERSLLRVVYRIKSKSIAESDIRAWYELNGNKVDLTLNDRGELISLPDLSTYRANPVVSTNVPRKDIVLSLRMRPDIPMTTSMDAATLNASLVQADKGTRRIASIFAFLRPKVKGYLAEIQSGETAEIVYPNGTTKPLTVKYIDPRVSHVDIDRNDLASASELRFSVPPFELKYSE